MKAERARRRREAEQALTGVVDFEIKNQGHHFIVYCPTGVMDYWPGSQRFISRDGVVDDVGDVKEFLEECLGGE